jgi:hypothetical protein
MDGMKNHAINNRIYFPLNFWKVIFSSKKGAKYWAPCTTRRPEPNADSTYRKAPRVCQPKVVEEVIDAGGPQQRLRVALRTADRAGLETKQESCHIYLNIRHVSTQLLPCRLNRWKLRQQKAKHDKKIIGTTERLCDTSSGPSPTNYYAFSASTFSKRRQFRSSN